MNVCMNVCMLYIYIYIYIRICKLRTYINIVPYLSAQQYTQRPRAFDPHVRWWPVAHVQRRTGFGRPASLC